MLKYLQISYLDIFCTEDKYNYVWRIYTRDFALFVAKLWIILSPIFFWNIIMKTRMRHICCYFTASINNNHAIFLVLEFCFLCVGNFYVETFKVSGIRNNMNLDNKIIMDLHKLLIYIIVLMYNFNTESIYGSIRKSLCIIIKGFIEICYMENF